MWLNYPDYTCFKRYVNYSAGTMIENWCRVFSVISMFSLETMVSDRCLSGKWVTGV